MNFFDQLWEFSERYGRKIGLDSNHSLWGYSAYRTGKPRGVVVHYTADEDFHRVLRWFCNARFNSKSSSNVVIADMRYPHHDECARGLPLIDQLPVTVIMCRKIDEAGWHATWVNAETFGIENVCAGELREGPDGEFVTYRKRTSVANLWTDPWKPALPKDVVFAYGKHWATYTCDQIEANYTVVDELQKHFGSLERSWVVGHEHVQVDKVDPGPDFPITHLRDTVLPPTQSILPGEASLYLDELGYAVDTASFTATVRIFQTMVDLKPDGVAGPKTLAALKARAATIGLIVPEKR